MIYDVVCNLWNVNKREKSLDIQVNYQSSNMISHIDDCNWFGSINCFFLSLFCLLINWWIDWPFDGNDNHNYDNIMIINIMVITKIGHCLFYYHYYYLNCRKIIDRKWSTEIMKTLSKRKGILVFGPAASFIAQRNIVCMMSKMSSNVAQEVWHFPLKQTIINQSKNTNQK